VIKERFSLGKTSAGRASVIIEFWDALLSGGERRTGAFGGGGNIEGDGTVSAESES